MCLKLLHLLSKMDFSSFHDLTKHLVLDMDQVDDVTVLHKKDRLVLLENPF